MTAHSPGPNTLRHDCSLSWLVSLTHKDMTAHSPHIDMTAHSPHIDMTAHSPHIDMTAHSPGLENPNLNHIYVYSILFFNI
jgi:hypothetical protein